MTAMGCDFWRDSKTGVVESGPAIKAVDGGGGDGGKGTEAAAPPVRDDPCDLSGGRTVGEGISAARRPIVDEAGWAIPLYEEDGCGGGDAAEDGAGTTVADVGIEADRET